MSGGTFAVARSIWKHPAFAEEPFTEREAYMWLIGSASFRAGERRAGKVVAFCERGQLLTSVRFMAEAWQWSKSRVDRFLKRLEKRDTIRTETGTGQLLITICDYDEFQHGPYDSGTLAGQQAGHERDTSGTNKKKDKKVEEEDTSLRSVSSQTRGSRLPADWCLSRDLGQWAVSEGMDPPQVRREAEKFRDYWTAQPGAKGRKADWSATWRNWIRKALESAPRTPSPANGADGHDRFAAALRDAERSRDRRAGGPGMDHGAGRKPARALGALPAEGRARDDLSHEDGGLARCAGRSAAGGCGDGVREVDPGSEVDAFAEGNSGSGQVLPLLASAGAKW